MHQCLQGNKLVFFYNKNIPNIKPQFGFCLIGALCWI